MDNSVLGGDIGQLGDAIYASEMACLKVITWNVPVTIAHYGHYGYPNNNVHERNH